MLSFKAEENPDARQPFCLMACRITKIRKNPRKIDVRQGHTMVLRNYVQEKISGDVQATIKEKPGQWQDGTREQCFSSV